MSSKIEEKCSENREKCSYKMSENLLKNDTKVRKNRENLTGKHTKHPKECEKHENLKKNSSKNSQKCAIMAFKGYFATLIGSISLSIY